MLGISLVAVGAESATLRLDVGPDVINRQGGLHGGAVSALIDIAGATAALYGNGGEMRRNATVSMTVQFLEAVLDGTVLAHASVIRRGAAITVADVKVTDDRDRLVATALMTYRLNG
jgi:uncharacterized protein (TIGR00369 family)